MLCNGIKMSLKPKKQKWQSDVTETSACYNHKLFKIEHTYETFFDMLSPAYLQNNDQLPYV